MRNANSCSDKLENMDTLLSMASVAASCSVGIAKILRDQLEVSSDWQSVELNSGEKAHYQRE